MGQAKERLRRALAEQPYCVFCGGTTPATSIDHCPPKSMFDGFRPKGLEFPQCAECQQGTRPIDLIMGMLCRIYPDPGTEAGRLATRRAIRGFVNNHPELAQSFISGDEEPVLYQGAAAYPIRLEKNTRLHRVVLAFAARLGAGLFYDLTKRPVPAEWSIVVRWQTNAMLDEDEELERLLRSFGAPRTLAMGKQVVPQEFRYWSGFAIDDPSRFLAFAAFRASFGVTAIVQPPDRVPDNHPAVFRPGFLKGFLP